ncbi:MAG TPA: acyclic terpene utilization AtuA family protein [Acidimicrobiales bacterium]|nr:acyclic terpene utilization AtuA family protein [Acidimicrobiales bacterium]
MSDAGARRDVLRIANCSGFFGDRLSAAREMVEGGPIDVLTGDWLAELTMYILHKTRERSGGYARTFLRELEEVLPACIERGITVVANAGGLDPEGLAVAVRELARRQGVDVRVASVSGDDITPRLEELRAGGERFVNLDTGEPLPNGAPVVTANAYLRARPIADALAAGAQVVVTGRVTDAALVVGPALRAFGWSDGDLDAIAGAVVAGHVIECGAQCCGGNYAFFEEVPGRERIGFPIAEVAADGSSVITKHPGTGGAVTVGTVTAQLLYEIGSPRYLSPDAVARFDTIELTQEGIDRVRVAGVRGEVPPETLKVTANLEGGWRNSMTLALTGAQPVEKARFAADAVWAAIPGGRGRGTFAETAEDLSGDLSGLGMAYLRLAVRSDDEQAVGRAFSGAVVETSLASYPGTFFTSAPSGAQGVARYWPTTVAAAAVTPRIECEGTLVPPTPTPTPAPTRASDLPHVSAPESESESGSESEPGTDAGSGAGGAAPPAELVRVPLGILVGARSGDKGGDANVGVWADEDHVAQWLLGDFTTAALRALMPELAEFEVDRFLLPNLRAVNFVVHGILGWGVASNLRLDTQAKGLGELLRSRPVEVPAALVASGKPAQRLAARGAGAAGTTSRA